jgi:hypothetical protein
MMRGTLTLLTFVSVVFFPWPLSVALALISALAEPLLPLSAGLFFDALYYSPHSAFLPFLTLGGALVTAIAFFVRSRLNTGIIRG